jgi:DNA-binding NarL/FixJ family response regulator
MLPRKCRVLLVDDHPPVRVTLVQIIGEAGDGKQALQMMASCQPGVILMDLNMPRMNGIEASTLIRKTWKDTVIIGVCAIQDAYTMEAFLKAGAVAVISKDRLDELHDTIQRACANLSRSIGFTSEAGKP